MPPSEPSLTLSPEELAIARSVIYASLFDYPLTLAQLRQALVESDQTQTEILSTYCSSEQLPRHRRVPRRLLLSRPASARSSTCRREREARSRAFLERHRRLLRLVCAMPYTRMVALSGSIAHLNLEGGGDLDLFIVTRGRHVWSVTVAVLVLAKLLRRRRILCANFVLSDTHLAFAQQDLFTANQVIHLRPILGANLLDDILAANPFVDAALSEFPGPRGAARAIPAQPPGRTDEGDRRTRLPRTIARRRGVVPARVRLASSPARGVMAIAGGSATAAGLPQAAYPQPPALGSRTLRSRDVGMRSSARNARSSRPRRWAARACPRKFGIEQNRGRNRPRSNVSGNPGDRDDAWLACSRRRGPPRMNHLRAGWITLPGAAVATERLDVHAPFWTIERDGTSVATMSRGETDGERALVFRYELGSGRPLAQFAALVAAVPHGLARYDRITFRARASHPLRLAVTLRPAGHNNPPLWRRSVYLDHMIRTVTVFFDDMHAVPGNAAGPAPLASIGALMFLVDTNNTKPGTSGEIVLSEMAYAY